MRTTQPVSLRVDAATIDELRRIAAEEAVTVSELLRQAALNAVREHQRQVATPDALTAPQREIQRTVERLRVERDALPTVPGVDRSCGNLGVHDEGWCWYEHCGQPVQMWSQEAWDFELTARKLEEQWS
jgi:hypothetical protein